MKKRSSWLLVATLLCPLVLATPQVTAEEATTTTFEVSSSEAVSTEAAEPAAEPKGKTIPIQMLGVNDFHGALNTTGTAYLEGGAKFANTGRASVLATDLNKAQTDFETANANGVTERIQAGDLVGASPANSALLRDEPTIKVFNQMNFTMGTLGNHEFDKGLGEFIRIINGQAPTREAMGNISDNLWQAIDSYPREKSTQEFMVANITVKGDNKPEGKAGEIPYDLPPYTIKTYGEGEDAVKVGYIGVVTKEFPNLVLAEHTENLVVEDEGTAVARYTKELRENQGVNAIVVISHVAATSSNEEVKGEVVDMMETVDANDKDNSVDVVFAGHNHQFTNGLIKREGKSDVRVVQSTSQGKAYIDLQGELDPKTQDFVSAPTATVVATVNDGVTEDAAVQATVDHASAAIKPITEEAIAKADLDKVTTDKERGKLISRSTNADDESELANLITDAQRQMVNASGVKADFAITNNGGIRADLLINDAGEITWGAAQTVQPFGNILQVVAMKGSDVREALNQQYNGGKASYFLQVSGLTYEYRGSAKEGTFRVVNVKTEDGKELDDNATYNVVINDFLRGGGDGFAAFKQGELVTGMDTDTETFVSYFKEQAENNKLIEAPEVGRKTYKIYTDQDLEEATVINPIKKGAKEVTGKTVPEASVTFNETTVQADLNGDFSFVLETGITEKTVTINFAIDDAKYDTEAEIVFPQGPYIKDGRHVQIVKTNYSLWSNFDWKERNKSNLLLGDTFEARGKYIHENGGTYLSLYDTKGKWQGYINENAVKVVTELQGSYIPFDKYVTVSRTGYKTWSNFDWKEREQTGSLIGETYLAKGQYKHANGSTYYSLYDSKGKWHGYVNKKAVKVGNGTQGVYVPYGGYVTVSKDNYKVWSNFDWKQRTTSKALHNQTYQAKGRYKHFNGDIYYSLYNQKGEWQGYINAKATKKGNGQEGAYISDGRKVKVVKKGYNTWSNFKWEKRDTTDNLLNQEFTARGKYNHYSGATYYSLYDTKGKWHGYVNANAVK